VAEKADVVIVGAGAIGASIAHHVARRGARDVLVIEREAVGAGSTGRSVGGIRHQFSTEVNVRLSLLSVQAFLRFRDELGMDPAFRQVGYLFLLTTAEDLEAFRANVAMQRRLGVAVRLIEPEEAREIVPQLNVDDVLGATFCSTDGYGDPHSVCLGYAERARELGVRFWVGAEVTSIEQQGGRVTAVQTSRGRVETRLVVDAAGPWAAEVARLAGVALPIQPYRRQVFITEPFPDIPRELPMVVDFAPSFYFRREGPAVLLGLTDKEEPPSFNTGLDWGFLEQVVAHAMHRVPVLERARAARGWAGLYDTTPDNNPILGRVPELEGFLVAAGFSGHGFMHSPATGRLMAELILDGAAHSVDISPLGISRFERDGPRERNVI
jgi:sarcosine oxidase subunit beta